MAPFWPEKISFGNRKNRKTWCLGPQFVKALVAREKMVSLYDIINKSLLPSNRWLCTFSTLSSGIDIVLPIRYTNDNPDKLCQSPVYEEFLREL